MAAPRLRIPDAARTPRAFLIVLALLLLAGLAWWRRADALPPLGDEAECLRACLRWGEALSAPPGEIPRRLAALLASGPAPFLPAAAAPLRLLGASPAAAVMLVNAACAVLLIASVFGIGAILYGEGVGIAAAALAVSYPLALCLPRHCLPGTAETALASACVFAALRAEGSRRLSWHLALGIAFGLGALSSPAFVLFAAPPAAWIFLGPRRTLRYRGTLSRRILLLSAAAATAVLAAAPAFLLRPWARLGAAGPPSLAGPLRAAGLVADSALLLPMTILFVVGLASAAARRRADPALLLWFFVPLAALGLSGARDPRAFAAALPAAALVTAAGVSMIGRRAARAALIAAASLAAALNIAALTIPSARARLDASVPLGVRGARVAVVRSSIPAGEMGPPRRENWRLEEIARAVAARARGGGAALGWVIAPHPRFNRSALRYCIETGGHPVSWAPPARADFLITRILTAAQREQLRRLAAPWLRLERLESFPLPDGSEAELHRAWLTRRRRYDARDLPRGTGDASVPDEGAGRGEARHADRDDHPPGALALLPGHPLDPGAYRLAVRGRCARAAAGVPLARIEARAGGGRPLASRDVALPAGGDSGGYREVCVDFDMPRRDALDARVVHTGQADLWLDTVSIAPRVARAPADASDARSPEMADKREE